MFKLINESHTETLKAIITNISVDTRDDTYEKLATLLEMIKQEIPEKKRISIGRYSIIKKLGIQFYSLAMEHNIDILRFARDLFDNRSIDSFLRSLAVQLVAVMAVKDDHVSSSLSFIENAASDDDWIVRECSQGFVRNIIKKYPDEMKAWYLTMVKSDNPLKRRFVSESLRPVADNRWMQKDHTYTFSIIEHLFEESEEYPRTSVGNSLSDWLRVNKTVILPFVEKLAKSNNENARWIAYRACRNVIKDDPIAIMNMLNVESYKYKNKTYYVKDYK